MAFWCKQMQIPTNVGSTENLKSNIDLDEQKYNKFNA